MTTRKGISAKSGAFRVIMIVSTSQLTIMIAIGILIIASKSALWPFLDMTTREQYLVTLSWPMDILQIYFIFRIYDRTLIWTLVTRASFTAKLLTLVTTWKYLDWKRSKYNALWLWHCQYLFLPYCKTPDMAWQMLDRPHSADVHKPKWQLQSIDIAKWSFHGTFSSLATHDHNQEICIWHISGIDHERGGQLWSSWCNCDHIRDIRKNRNVYPVKYIRNVSMYA